MIQKKAIFALVSLVFITGAVSGYFFGARGQQVSSEAETTKSRQTETPRPQRSTEDWIMDWMVGFLEINESQAHEIRPLVRLAIREHRQLEREQDDRIDALIYNSDLRIAKHLTEEQTQKLLAHNRQKRERRDARLAEEEARQGVSASVADGD